MHYSKPTPESPGHCTRSAEKDACPVFVPASPIVHYQATLSKGAMTWVACLGIYVLDKVDYVQSREMLAPNLGCHDPRYGQKPNRTHTLVWFKRRGQ